MNMGVATMEWETEDPNFGTKIYYTRVRQLRLCALGYYIPNQTGGENHKINRWSMLQYLGVCMGK